MWDCLTRKPGVSVSERGTLQELYENINADIEEALPLLDDAHLRSPKYHFNSKAAYAFAARFNLYFHKYDKAIQYATAAIGSNPLGVLRNYAQYLTLAGVDDINNAYVAAAEPANFLMVTANSLIGRAQNSSNWRRYATHYDIWLQELTRAFLACLGVQVLLTTHSTCRTISMVEAMSQYTCLIW